MSETSLHGSPCVAVIGGGLAGCECALALANAGVAVTLFEQKPEHFSPAHRSPLLAELVCSNSFRSADLTSGIGLLKQEMRELGSQAMQVADAVAVPAGKALAVDREAFSRQISERIAQHPLIRLERREIASPEEPDLAAFDRVVVAAGPVASERLSSALAELTGSDHLYFYDAIAPIVAADSINMDIAFRGSRYEPAGEGDYLNCPMNQEEYRAFYTALLEAEQAQAHDFEALRHFEGCMPVEALAQRGERTLLFGSLKPVGFVDPRTGHRPWALLQLRPENLNASMYNLVGCQTRMTHAAQERVFRLVPGLEQADFVRLGSMHRNTYVNAPQVLAPDLSLKARPRIHLAGQISGVEGYVESLACGLWLGLLLAARLLRQEDLPQPPPTTALGGLLAHLQTPNKHFQPSNAHFGLMTEPDVPLKKKNRREWYSQRARADFAAWLEPIRM